MVKPSGDFWDCGGFRPVSLLNPKTVSLTIVNELSRPQESLDKLLRMWRDTQQMAKLDRIKKKRTFVARD